MRLFWWRKGASQSLVAGSAEHHCPTIARSLDLADRELDAAERAVPVAQYNTRRGFLLERLVDARQWLDQDQPAHSQAQNVSAQASFWANSWSECAGEHREEVVEVIPERQFEG